MGTIGSRGATSAPRTSEFHRLDLRQFDPAWFDQFCFGQVNWTQGNHRLASAEFKLSSYHMELQYSVGSAPELRFVHETIPLAFTEQPFGGRRRWFVCLSCGTRCRILFGAEFFRCRVCQNAKYESQYQRFRIASLARAEVARERVGALPGVSLIWPKKPKGMHWRTYRHLETVNWSVSSALDAMSDRWRR